MAQQEARRWGDTKKAQTTPLGALGAAAGPGDLLLSNHGVRDELQRAQNAARGIQVEQIEQKKMQCILKKNIYEGKTDLGELL